MKKLLFGLSAMLVAIVAQADVLYWQVNPSDSSVEYDYAMIKIGNAVDGTISEGTYANNYFANTQVGSSGYQKIGAPDEGFSAPKVLANLGNDYAAMSFIVELYSASSELAYTSGVLSFADAGSYIKQVNDFDSYINSAAEFTSNFQTMSALNVSNFSPAGNIPEPTSGLLLVIGSAFLGLRRRKQK